MALASILAVEVAAKEPELAAGDVHEDPLVHTLEILEERGGVLAGGEGETGVAGDLFGESAGIAVASEVRGVLVVDVGPPRVTTGGLFADLECELVGNVVAGGGDDRSPGRGCRCCSPC